MFGLDRRLRESADAIELGDRRADQADARFDERIAGLDLQQRREVGGRDAHRARGLDRLDAVQRTARDREGQDQLAALFFARVRRLRRAVALLAQRILDRGARILEQVLIDDRSARIGTSPSR